MSMVRTARKMMATLALALATPFSMGATDFDNQLETRLLAAHNRERAVLGIPEMAWSDTLARDAAAWGRHLAKIGYLEHYEETSYAPDAQGENLWAGTSGYYAPEAMVGLWIDEKKNYTSGIFPNVTRTGRLEDVGHYTQVIWRNTRKVGCALVRGEQDDFLVCRYAEGGNVIGERPV